MRKDGTRFLASVVIDAIYENGELIGFAKITRDITERSRREERAAAKASAISACWSSGVTDYALYMLDPERHRHRAGMRAASASRATRRKKSSASISRASTPMRISAAGRPARALRSRAETGRYEEEGWRVRKDGTFFWASVVIDPIRDEAGKLLGFAKITRDITERREAQLALERVQRQLAEVAEDGRARPAHRRRRARLQQSADDRQRQHPDAQEARRRRSEGVRAPRRRSRSRPSAAPP